MGHIHHDWPAQVTENPTIGLWTGGSHPGRLTRTRVIGGRTPMDVIRSRSRLAPLVLLGAMVGTLLVPHAASAVKPAQNCSPGYDLGAVTVEQVLALPRTIAAIDDGFFTEAEVYSMFAALDGNGDGYLCFKEPHGAFMANPASLWPYLYVAFDNVASKR